MTIFDVFIKIFPLYILIFLGYLGGRMFKVERMSIASLLFYIVIPIVFFDVALNTIITPRFLLLPVIFFCTSIFLCFVYYHMAKRIWDDGHANLIAFAAGTANTGYFGFPIALMIFNEQVVGLYMLANIGLSLYDYTVGAYVIASGKASKRETLYKVSRLPMIYAFMIGIVINNAGYDLPQSFQEITNHMKGTYVVLGMMTIGLGLSTVKKLSFNWKFLWLFLSSKFIASPLIMLGIIALDLRFFHTFDPIIHQVMLLLSIVPPAANTVIFATINDCHPNDASSGVLIGTIIAMIYVPTMVAILF
jgi:predicted permease